MRGPDLRAAPARHAGAPDRRRGHDVRSEDPVDQIAGEQPPGQCRQTEDAQDRRCRSGREAVIGQERHPVGDGAVDRDRDEEKRRSQDPETWQVGRFARDKPGELSCRALAEMTSAIQTALGYPKAISAWVDQRCGLALGIAMSGVGLGGFVIPQLANVLIERVGWRGAYVYLALMT